MERWIIQTISRPARSVVLLESLRVLFEMPPAHSQTFVLDRSSALHISVPRRSSDRLPIACTIEWQSRCIYLSLCRALQRRSLFLRMRGNAWKMNRLVRMDQSKLCFDIRWLTNEIVRESFETMESRILESHQPWLPIRPTPKNLKFDLFNCVWSRSLHQ